MFAILAAIGVMFGLSLARVPVVFALVIGAVTGGLLAGLGLQGGGLVDPVDGGRLELVLVGLGVVSAEQQVARGEHDSDERLRATTVTAVGSGEGGGGRSHSGVHDENNTTSRARLPVEGRLGSVSPQDRNQTATCGRCW